MSDNNLPADTGTVDDAPLSFDQGVSSLANLLADPETDTRTEDQDATADTQDDDPEIDVSEDVETDPAEDPDGSEPELKGGRFAPDSAKVTLDDGTVTTIAELKRGMLFQRDYTRKTQETADLRKALETEKASVSQQAQSLQAQAAAIAEFAKKYLPQDPGAFDGDPEADPIGMLRWMKEKRAYDDAMAEFGKVEGTRTSLTEEQRRTAEREQQDRVTAEMQALVQSDPFFADQKRVQSFTTDLQSNAKAWWGIDPAVFNSVSTAAELKVLRDAVLYRRALAKTQQVEKQVKDKPILPRTQGRRSDLRPQQNAARQQQTERLRKSGSLADAAPILADLISKTL